MSTPSQDQTPDALTLIERAEQVVNELCEGERRWTLSVPARPDHDPDLIIASGLHAAKKEIDALRARLAALEVACHLYDAASDVR